METFNSGCAASEAGWPSAWRTCMTTPPGWDMPRWAANILICWGLPPNTAPPRIHPQENGHTNCGTCHRIRLSHKERITGTRVNMDRRQTQYASETSWAQKSTHYVFLFIRKSTAGKANLRMIDIRKWLGRRGVARRGAQGNFLGWGKCFIFCFGGWLCRYIQLSKLSEVNT